MIDVAQHFLALRDMRLERFLNGGVEGRRGWPRSKSKSQE